jgi:hypothetical protein
VLAWPAYLYAATQVHRHLSYGGALSMALGVFVLISALVIWLPLKLGLNSLERHEV